MRVIGLVALAVMASLAACASTQANPARSPQTVSSPSITKSTIGLDPTGIARTTHTDVIPRSPNSPDEPPFMNGEPEHLRVRFGDDKLHDYTDYLQRQLLVYPLQPYAALFHGKEKKAFDKAVSELKSIITGQSDKGIKELPVLPSAEAYEVFHNQVRYLNFKQGSGVAFLSCYKQDESPITNSDLFYTFQGLTHDNKYYVSFFCPVQANGLPASVPSKQGAGYLGKLSRAEFVPSLDKLDHVIESISLK